MERPLPSAIPVTPGVYLYKDAGGRILYVGKARNLRRRVLSYFRPPEQLTPKTRAMLNHAATLDTLSTTTEKEALLLEASLIKKHRPRYNIVLRDDKQYVLFRLAIEDEFPRLEIVRKKRKGDRARYFGPFTSGQAARETWKWLHRIFPLRRCTDRVMRNRIRPCLYYHINLCLAPCTGQADATAYAEMIRRVSLLLEGRSRELTEQLRQSMERAAEALDFEQAAVLRDQLRAVEKTVERQAVIIQAGSDLDVLGIASRPDGLALGILFVRQGAVIDRSTFFWPGLGLAEEGELLWSFLGQFYGADSMVPPRVIVPWLPGEAKGNKPDHALSDSVSADTDSRTQDMPAHDTDDGEESSHAALEAALADLRGGPVRITPPRNTDERRLVEMARTNAREAARSRSDLPLEERLAVIFRTQRPLRRIECVDVSHTGGTSTKVGMVVYEEGRPVKSDYRVWNIDGAGGDDYLALGQWAARRLEHGPLWPDLLLIDGGRGQLSAVDSVFREGFQGQTLPFLLAGIAKARDERGHADRRAGNVADRIFIPGRSNPLPLREGCAELLFLQSVRDAAHDFSLGRHRQARAREAFSGELQSLPGVGPHTARLLWEHFPSLEAMKAAGREELATLPGIGRKKAEALWQSLRSL